VVPMRGWMKYLILVPAFMGVGLLALFFFIAFVVLFALGTVAFGIWFWWLQRKLRKAAGAQALEGEYVVINETQSVEKDVEKNAERADDR
jgi:hypothetical protein